MKRLFFLLTMALLAALALTAPAQPRNQVDSIQLVVLNSSTTVPVRLSSNHVAFASMTVIGNKAERTANTGTVYIGPTSTNDTQALAITSGATITLVAPVGETIDLYNWWLDPATANDGVVLIVTK